MARHLHVIIREFLHLCVVKLHEFLKLQRLKIQFHHQHQQGIIYVVTNAHCLHKIL